MKILALSDTHGNLSHINRLIGEHDADVVLHMGDFGFMTHERTEALPERELSLNIKHSSKLPWEIRKQAWDMDREEKISIIREHQVLGEFDAYINGIEEFNAPVYAVWGNHEDAEIVRRILDNKIRVPNLELVTYQSDILLPGKIRLLGIGGNFTLKYFYQKPYTNPFYPFMTFQEWVHLYLKVKNNYKSDNIWLMTHVSPGKQPLLELFGFHIQPDMWFSGHMGVPFPQHYSLFTFMDDPHVEDRIGMPQKFAKQLFHEYMGELGQWFDLVDYIRDNIHDAPQPYELIAAFEQKHNVKINKKQEVEGAKLISSLSKGKDLDESMVDYPTRGMYKMLSAHGRMLDLPFDSGFDIGNLDEYYRRMPASKVRKTWFFNLPDVYTNGYVVLDTDTSNGKRYQVQAFGSI